VLVGTNVMWLFVQNIANHCSVLADKPISQYCSSDTTISEKN